MTNRKTLDCNISLINDKMGRLDKNHISYLHHDGLNFVMNEDDASLFLHKNNKALLLSFITKESFYRHINNGTISKDTIKNHLEALLNNTKLINVGANTRALANYMYHRYFQQAQ